MHAIKLNGWTMHFDTDMSGTVHLTTPGGVNHDGFPGELIRAYVHQYVLLDVREKMNDLLREMVGDELGVSGADHALVAEGVRWLKPASEIGDGTDVLHGTRFMFGSPFHVTFLRVVMNDDGCHMACDPNYARELERAHVLGEPDGEFTTVELPGYDGEYVCYSYPHTR